MNKNVCMLPGVFMNVFNIGTLITGESNSGKSELALSLIDRKHQLIADDAVEFYSTNGQVIGRSPPELQDLLEVKGLGIINVRQLFGNEAIASEQKLTIIINLIQIKNIDGMQRLQGIQDETSILNISFPVINIPIQSTRQHALLTECAVKQFMLTKQTVISNNETSKEIL